MNSTIPILTPPCRGWREDFNAPNEPPKKIPSILFLPSNQINDIYLELHRSSITMRGLLPICIALSILPFIITTEEALEAALFNDYTALAISLLFLILQVWQTTIFFRLLRETPRDEPIRFNRVRQKIYAYNFVYCWWNPFITWPIKVATYDWADVRAERWRKSGTLPQGSHVVKVGIMLSIVAPGTNKVIDRFPLSVECDNESIWAYICTYMQQGPSAVPTPPPGPDHNDLLWYQSKRFGPKVNWPKSIDHESRTSPGVHERPTQNQERPNRTSKQ